MSHYPVHREVGHLYACRKPFTVPPTCAFLQNPMSRPTFINSKVVYHDNSREYNIDARGKDLASVMRALDAEDISPFQAEKTEPNSLFCRITKAAYEKGVAQNVEDDLRSACVSAPKLVKKVKLNEALGYLDTEDLPSTDLYDLLNEHYHLPFKIRTFQDNRGK